MYRFHRIARISRGNQREATQWAVEVAERISANHPTVTVQAFSELFGDTGTIHWYADYEELADWEEHNAQLLADQEYWAMIEKGTEFFIEGSIQDEIVQSL